MLEMERPVRDVKTDVDIVFTDPSVEEAPVGLDRPYHEVFTPPSTPRGSGIRRFLPGGGGGGRRRPGGESADDGGKLDLRNSWQVAAGSILIPLGVVLILLAWYGAAHARVVQQQIPYEVSGAFAGLGCMVLGGLFFFGHWLYRIWDQADLHHEEQMRVFEEVARSLAAIGAGAAAAPASMGVSSGAVTGAPAPSGAAGSSGYLVTASGTVYHQSDCPVIAHHPNDLRVLGASDLVGLRPCQICLPD